MSQDSAPGRRAALLSLSLGVALGFIGTAAAQTPVKLFKVITSKDSVTIGVTAAELTAMGSGEDVKVLAQALVAAGQITVWQYAVGRDASGKLMMARRHQIAILKNDTLRIEPETTPYRIAPSTP